MDLKLKIQLKQKFDIIEEAQINIKKITNQYLPDNGLFYEVSNFWDCSESPFGLCAYHTIEDPAHDQCVFCGEPFERK